MQEKSRQQDICMVLGSCGSDSEMLALLDWTSCLALGPALFVDGARVLSSSPIKAVQCVAAAAVRMLRPMAGRNGP